MKAITEFPEPKDQKDIQRFHGLINYVREYIPNFSELAKPLTDLLKKNKPFIWSEDQMRLIHKFKELLASSPVRHIYDHNKHCELHTDASTIGIAGILIQDNHPIGYYSRKLSMQRLAILPQNSSVSQYMTLSNTFVSIWTYPSKCSLITKHFNGS